MMPHIPHINEEQISAYIDGQLPADENRSIEIHIQECTSCRAVHDELSTLTQFFRDSERLEPPAFLWNRIAADFDKERPATPGWVASIMAYLRGYSRSMGMAAASITILIIVGIVAYHGNRMPAADRVALAQIDQISRDLAAQDPDGYNPFVSGAPSEMDANPFRSMRLKNKAYGAPPEGLPHD
jgi:anti-sigma factor RsiW